MGSYPCNVDARRVDGKGWRHIATRQLKAAGDAFLRRSQLGSCETWRQFSGMRWFAVAVVHENHSGDTICGVNSMECAGCSWRPCSNHDRKQKKTSPTSLNWLNQWMTSPRWSLLLWQETLWRPSAHQGLSLSSPQPMRRLGLSQQAPWTAC